MLGRRRRPAPQNPQTCRGPGARPHPRRHFHCVRPQFRHKTIESRNHTMFVPHAPGTQMVLHVGQRTYPDGGKHRELMRRHGDGDGATMSDAEIARLTSLPPQFARGNLVALVTLGETVLLPPSPHPPPAPPSTRHHATPTSACCHPSACFTPPRASTPLRAFTPPPSRPPASLYPRRCSSSRRPRAAPTPSRARASPPAPRWAAT